MNNLQKNHIGVIQTLMQEFETHRLPILLEIKQKVDAGGTINEGEIEFLDKVMEDADRTIHLTVNYPELHNFCQQVVHLYKEVTTKALLNENT